MPTVAVKDVVSEVSDDISRGTEISSKCINMACYKMSIWKWM